MNTEQQYTETSTFLGECEKQDLQKFQPACRRNTPTIWTSISILTILSCSLVLNTFLLLKPHKLAFQTDIQDAANAVEHEPRKYTGALTYDEEKKEFLRVQDSDTEYFGYPSASINAAWADLLKGGFPEMTEQEVKPFLPDLTPWPATGKYHFEPDVFHSLHCLDAVRKQVAPTMYNVSSVDLKHIAHHTHGIQLPPKWGEIHLEHCMDRIRQALMCHGDLTPSPMYSWANNPIAVGKAGVHTCRKWEPIVDWAEKRKQKGVWVPAA